MNTLNDMLAHAITHSQYYRQIMKASGDDINLDSFPVLTKEDLQKHMNDILIDRYHNAHVKMLKLVRTTGSTGKITELYWDNDDYNASNLTLWRLRYKWYGILPTSKKVVFNSMIYNGSRLSFPAKVKYYNNRKVLGFSKFEMNDTDLAVYLEEMQAFQPEWMLVQTSVLLRLMDFLKKHKLVLPSSIKYIELNGELTLPSVRKQFEEFFDITIADMYGAIEVNAIAFECPMHHMHVLTKNVFVETNDNNDILVTSLHNRAVPLIRYSVGDKVYIEKEKCMCGYEGMTIKLFEGRTTDIVKLKNNRYINPYVFLYCIEKSNQVLSNAILQYKIIQNVIDHIVIRIVIDDRYLSWGQAIVKELKNNIDNIIKLPEVVVDINIVDKINDFSSDKFKVFETHI